MEMKRGRCLCGAVSYEYEGPENWRGHCHCASCRRNTAAPFTTFMGVAKSAYRFTGETPAVYHSSPGVRRYFCATCGTPIAYESDRWPDETHFYAAGLETPEDFVPDFHVHWAERLPWVHLDDDLPKYEKTGS
ncbi:GFA family protein [Pelagibius sp.]|uniref:GFA family protein n=1 Tax=Pelagibius sp. TaxID=1931238 RepID=UPI00260C9A62|nr:GFA family protein [Pelagibius sp.]